MFEKNSISIITGKPGSGKTVYAIKLANELQEFYGKDVLFITLDSNEETIKRQSYNNNISFKVVSFNNADINTIKQSINNAVMQNQDKNNKGINVVVIDYLQLMNVECENREDGCRKIIEELKKIALDKEIHIVLLSQCSRTTDNKMIKFPSYIEEKFDELEVHIVNNVKKGIFE